ncbi:MAG: glycosyltransferase [Rivularia sp. (in: cyanobacteria)]|jgi:glycosyltransferase involved in cell wall biosynthesis
MNSNCLRILIQHRHKANEIAGVTSYIDLLKEEFEIKNIEHQVISTAETSFTAWIRSIWWSDIVYMHSNNPAFVLFSRLLLRKVVLMYHYKFYLTECSLENISFVERLKIEIRHLFSVKHLPLKWKLERILQSLKLGGRLAASYWSNELMANTHFLASSTYLPKKIHVFPYPCPKELNSNAKTLQDLNNPLTFTFAGRLCKEKGVDILLAAVEKLVSTGCDFQVNIIGSGNLSDSLRKTASQSGLDANIKFLGRLPLEETIELMRRSIAVVVPSRWQEPAGRVVLEAATVGTSVIAARVGGMPELGGDECLYFEKEDVEGLYQAMVFCLNNPQKTLDSGLKLQARIQEKHSISGHADNLLKLFQAI